LGLGYVSDIVSVVHSFVASLLRFVVANNSVRESLMGLLTDELKRRHRVALQYTKFLLEVELEGTPATYSYYFNDALSKEYVSGVRK
jgi:hypothetical protein